MTKKEFLTDVQGWNNHRYLLWEALKLTKGKVVEFGCGDGSTPYLDKYCKKHKREFKSYEGHKDWANKFNSHFIEDWEQINESDIDVLFIDHAPGERRHLDVIKYANIAKIIVIHDSEPEATGYMMDKVWHLFKYRKDYTSTGAWATMVSNFIEL